MGKFGELFFVRVGNRDFFVLFTEMLSKLCKALLEKTNLTDVSIEL